MTTPFEYAEQHSNQFETELKDLLRIPSISTLSEHNDDTRKAAEWLQAHMTTIGLEARVMETAGHPIVYGEWLQAGDDKPTVLVYGHYDVQPVDPLHLWETPPFEPDERNGNLYARGATDDKGQSFLHLKAIESMLKTTGELPVNVKVMLEGEEESGSPNLEPFLREHVDLLSCDVVLVSDTHVISETQPSIVYGLRGMIYMELEVFGAKSDLHSGGYGGAVHNPVQALAEIVAKLHDEDGRVSVPGFYEAVQDLSPEERKAIGAHPTTEDDFKKRLAINETWGEPGYSIWERIGARPTLEINGIVGGWTGEGAKTVIGSTALAKVSCRLVPDQDPTRIYEQINAYVEQITPPTVRSELRILHQGGSGVMVPIDAPPMKAASQAYQAAFGVEPLLMREGGSIPVVGLYRELLNVPVVLMGFGLPDDNLHAPNEKFTLSMFHKGIQTILHFYEKLPSVMESA